MTKITTKKIRLTHLLEIHIESSSRAGYNKTFSSYNYSFIYIL
jgi:hypothetical protein